MTLEAWNRVCVCVVLGAFLNLAQPHSLTLEFTYSLAVH